jgi:hypothetical protein
VLGAFIGGGIGWVVEVEVQASRIVYRPPDGPRPETPAAASPCLGLAFTAAGNAATGAERGEWDSSRFLVCVVPTGLPADTCAALAAVLEMLDPSTYGDAVREHVFCGELSPEHTMYLWGPLAEALDSSEADVALAALAGLPGDVFPLLRLCVLRRLEHRWDGQLAESQQTRLADLIGLAEADVEAHFASFAERVSEEMQRMTEGGDEA